MIDALKHRMHAKSAALLLSLESRLDRIMLAWLGLAGLASAVRIAVSPIHTSVPDITTYAPYILLVFAPVVSLLLALRWFANGEQSPQPQTRLARVGKWRNVSRHEARSHELYGTTGIMVSLLV